MNDRTNAPELVWSLLLCLEALIGSSTTHAQNWPSFRGPNGTGIGTGSPPVTWSVETGENVKRKTPIPGLAHSSPIVWGDRVYLTTAIPVGLEPKLNKGWMSGSIASAQESGQWEWKVLAIDKATGKTVWEQTAHKGAPMFKRHPKSTHANGTPATDGKHVVTFFGSEGLYCYSTDGDLLWKKDLGPLNSSWSFFKDYQWGTATSPIIHDGKAILQCDAANTSFWVALDVKDGKEIFRVDRGDVATWTTPSIHVGKGLTQLVCNGYKKMAGYDLATGKELWSLSGGGDIPVPRPIVSGDLFFITNGHSRSPIFAVRADAKGVLKTSEDGPADGLAWWSNVRGSYMPTPIVVDDLLYVADDNGVLSVFESASGKQVYRQRLPGGGNATYSASPVAADGRLYVINEDGQVDVIKTGREFQVLASNQMNEVCMATPAIADGVLFIRTRDHLYCIGR
jgi:outer membrane protein assembly factor BamB